MACPRNLASKIFCSCCRDSKETSSTDDSSISSQMQEQKPGLQASELDRQNPTSKYTSAASSLPLGQSMIQSEKDSWSSSSDFDDVPQRGFQKRNLDRYSQLQWPFQPCLIGRP